MRLFELSMAEGESVEPVHRAVLATKPLDCSLGDADRGGRRLLRMVFDDGDGQKALDIISTMLEHEDGWRLVVLPVEAHSAARTGRGECLMTYSSRVPAQLIRTDPVVLAVWTRLTSVFATWRAIVLSGFTRRALRMFSNDQLTPLTRAVHWKIGLGLLGGLDDAQIDFLQVYAGLNADRVERIFRITALLLITVPVGAIIGLNEIQPGIWAEIGFGQVESLFGVLGGWAVLTGVLMAASWRARDLADLVLFEQARRRLARESRALQG